MKRPLKTKLTSDGVIVPYGPNLPLVLASDAGPNGIGAVLSNVVDDVERPIAYV